MDKKNKRKEKDNTNAGIIATIFTIAFCTALLNQSLFGIIVSIAILAIILYMDNEKTKVEKRLEHLRKAYNELFDMYNKL